MIWNPFEGFWANEDMGVRGAVQICSPWLNSRDILTLVDKLRSKPIDPNLPYLLKVVGFYSFLALGSFFLLWQFFWSGLLVAGFTIFGGILFWSLLEYGLHRFIFHIESNNPSIQKMATGFHGQHHQESENPEFLVARIPLSFAIAGIIFIFLAGCNWFFNHSLSLALGLMTGIFLGYIFYEWVHFAAHQYPSRGFYSRWYKKNHLRHHFQDDTKAFGVTSPLWDFIFGTQ